MSQFLPGATLGSDLGSLASNDSMRRRDDYPLFSGLLAELSPFQRKKTLRGEDVWPMDCHEHTYLRWCGVEVRSMTPELPQVVGSQGRACTPTVGSVPDPS